MVTGQTHMSRNLVAIVLVLTVLPFRVSPVPAAEANDPSSEVIVIGTADLAMRGEIYRVNADGSNRKLLTSGFDPALSPDAKRVVFIDGVDEKAGLYVINIEGTGRERVLTNINFPQPWLAPSWSPDGKQIAFCKLNYGAGAGRGLGPEGSSIVIVDADGKNMHPAGKIQGMYPHWSPDGKRLVYAKAFQGGGLFAADVDGSNETALLGREAAAGVWSPDGVSLAYVILEGDAASLYVANADGSNSRRMAGGRDEVTLGPQWSSDSKRVYFTWMEKPQTQEPGEGFASDLEVEPDYPAPSAVHVIGANGQGLRRVTQSDNPEYCGQGVSLFAFGSDRDDRERDGCQQPIGAGLPKLFRRCCPKRKQSRSGWNQ